MGNAVVRQHLRFDTPEDVARWYAAGDGEGRARLGEERLGSVVSDKPMIVRCPACSNGTQLVFGAFRPDTFEGRLGCKCGYTLRIHQVGWLGSAPRLWGKVVDIGKDVQIGIDPKQDEGCIALPFYLEIDCVQQRLWVANRAHLEVLEKWVGATLRERSPNTNRSLASCLPKWMVEAKNREAVLKGLQRLRGRLDAL